MHHSKRFWNILSVIIGIVVISLLFTVGASLAGIDSLLTGRAWNDLNGNGIQDPGEPGIPNLLVLLVLDSNVNFVAEEDDGPAVMSTFTDGDGDYVFPITVPYPVSYPYFVAISFPDGADDVSPFQVGDNPSIDSDGTELLLPGDDAAVSPVFGITGPISFPVFYPVTFPFPVTAPQNVDFGFEFDGDSDDDDNGGGGEGGVAAAAAPVGATQGFCNVIGGPARGFVGSDSGNDAFCRVINENGTFLTNPAEIGNMDVLNQGVLQALDVFSFDDNGNPKIPFAGQVRICLRGQGQILFLNAATFDRALQGLEAVSEGGYTCAFLPNAGTVVLVNGPAAPAAGGGDDAGSGDDTAGATGATTTAGSVPLDDCRATTTFAVRGRSTPDMSSDENVVTTLPFDLTLQATERLPGWLRVIYLDGQVWISEDFLSTAGSCGG